MDDNRSFSALSGSEARPNTPMPSERGLGSLDLTSKRDELVAKELKKLTGKELKGELWPSRNIVLSRGIIGPTKSNNQAAPLGGNMSKKSCLFKLNTRSSLAAEIVKRSNSFILKQNHQNRSKHAVKVEAERNKLHPKNNYAQKAMQMNTAMDSQTTNGNPTVRHKKPTISLPKIDTYCISKVRPSTGHGFSYMVSSSDLLDVKTKAQKCRTSREKRVARVSSRNHASSSAESDFSCTRNLYLMFRAPSRAGAYKDRPFTVHTKPSPRRTARQADHARGKGLQGCNEIRNIVRLPGIKEDVRK